VAVSAFLAEKIKFPAIIQTVARVVDALSSNAPTTIRDIADVSAIEQSARIKADEFIKGISA
jgi:1-deoxy-D-xylulose-5-phosphate reductoisomerase